MEARPLQRDGRVFSRDDVTKRANYIGTRNGPHGCVRLSVRDFEHAAERF